MGRKGIVTKPNRLFKSKYRMSPLASRTLDRTSSGSSSSFSGKPPASWMRNPCPQSPHRRARWESALVPCRSRSPVPGLPPPAPSPRRSPRPFARSRGPRSRRIPLRKRIHHSRFVAPPNLLWGTRFGQASVSGMADASPFLPSVRSSRAAYIAKCAMYALHLDSMRTGPPLDWSLRVSPPDPMVPLRWDFDRVPTTWMGKSLLTDPAEADASRFKLAERSSLTVTPPPDVSNSPPCALSLANATSTEPPDVLASTRPPASSMRIEPPEVWASKSPPTLSKRMEPPLVLASSLPVILFPSIEPPEVSTSTFPLISSTRMLPPEELAWRLADRSDTLMDPPEVRSLASPRRPEISTLPPLVLTSVRVSAGTWTSKWTQARLGQS